MNFQGYMQQVYDKKLEKNHPMVLNDLKQKKIQQRNRMKESISNYFLSKLNQSH